MMRSKASLTAVGAATLSAAALVEATVVRYTGQPPTGYVVDFTFQPNSSNITDPSFVMLGGMPKYSDPLHASSVRTAGYEPWDWKPDDFSMGLFADYNLDTYSGWNMAKNNVTGDWELTLPFPSGTFNYAFYPDCGKPWGPIAPYTDGNCVAWVDATNLPIEARTGDQLVSTIQVPFDEKFQKNDYDWQLPLPDANQRGSIAFHQYPSPGSTYPAPNIHDVGVYLPAEYDSAGCENKTYPVLYISHGGGGTDSDWFNQARLHNIADRLIAARQLEPTIIITPNFYDLGFTMAQYATNGTIQGFDVVGLNGFFNAVRLNYLAYLIPWVESTFRVDATPARRAFAGLSLGGGLSLTMLFNATETFGSFSIMSNTLSPEPGDPIYNQTTLQDVGIFLGAGFYDVAFENSRNAQDRLAAVRLGYLSHYPLNGAHQWSTWQEAAWYYMRYGLWKATPYTFRTDSERVTDMSGGVPY